MVPTPNRGFARAELLNAVLPNRELSSAVFPNCELEKAELPNRTLPNLESAKAELPIAELPNDKRPNRELPDVVLPKCEFSKLDSTRLGEIADPIALGAFVVIPGEVVLIAEEGVVGLELSAHMSRPCPDQLFVANPVATDPTVNERFKPALKLSACVFAAMAPPAPGPDGPRALSTEALPAFPNECH